MTSLRPSQSLRPVADLARSGWVLAAGAAGLLGGRFAATAPTWAFVSGGMTVVSAAGVWLAPLLTAGGLATLKQAMPLSVTAMVFSIVIGVLALAAGAWRRLPRAPAVFFGLFLVVALPSVRTTPAPWDAVPPFFLPGTDWQIVPVPAFEVQAALGLTGMLGLAAVVALGVRTLDDRDRLLGMLTAGAAIPILLGIKDKITGNLSWHDGHPSIEGAFGHPNAFAVYLVAAVPVLIAFGVSARDRRLRFAASGIGALGAVCLLFTYTRAAWLAVIAALILGALLAGQVRRLLAAGAVCAALAVGTGVAGTVTERLQGLSMPDLSAATVLTPNDSWSWRMVTWSRMLGQTPGDQVLTGSGYGSYERRTVEVFGLDGGQIPTKLRGGWRRGFGAHNDLVEQYVETGYVGLGLWVGFMLSLCAVAANAWRRGRDPLALGVFVAATALALMSISDNVQAYDYAWFLVAGVVTAVWCTRHEFDSAGRSEPELEREPVAEAAGA